MMSSFTSTMLFTHGFVRVPMLDTTGMYNVCPQCLVWRQTAITVLCSWIPLLATPFIVISRDGYEALSLSRQRVRMLQSGPWHHVVMAHTLLTRDALRSTVRRYALPMTVVHIVLAYVSVLPQVHLSDKAMRAVYANPDLFADQFASVHERKSISETSAGWLRWLKRKIVQ